MPIWAHFSYDYSGKWKWFGFSAVWFAVYFMLFGLDEHTEIVGCFRASMHTGLSIWCSLNITTSHSPPFLWSCPLSISGSLFIVYCKATGMFKVLHGIRGKGQYPKTLHNIQTHTQILQKQCSDAVHWSCFYWFLSLFLSVQRWFRAFPLAYRICFPSSFLWSKRIRLGNPMLPWQAVVLFLCLIQNIRVWGNPQKKKKSRCLTKGMIRLFNCCQAEQEIGSKLGLVNFLWIKSPQ